MFRFLGWIEPFITVWPCLCLALLFAPKSTLSDIISTQQVSFDQRYHVYLFSPQSVTFHLFVPCRQNLKHLSLRCFKASGRSSHFYSTEYLCMLTGVFITSTFNVIINVVGLNLQLVICFFCPSLFLFQTSSLCAFLGEKSSFLWFYFISLLTYY